MLQKMKEGKLPSNPKRKKENLGKKYVKKDDLKNYEEMS